MSELIKTHDNRSIRRRLMSGASALALAAYVSSANVASAADADRPLIWLEASGQFDQLDDGALAWTPEFVPGYDVGPMADQYTSIQRRPKFGFDADASISFQPKDSDWSLRASIRIGKARQPGSVLVTHALPSIGNGKYSSHYGGTSHSNESHQILDFQVGKDVDLGAAAWDSTIRAGVRIADLRSRSDVQVSTNVPFSSRGFLFNDASSRISRKFAGTGPSIVWDASIPVAGTVKDGELAVDWTAAAALLFGRQTVRQNSHATHQQVQAEFSTYGVFESRSSTRHNVQYTNLRHKKVTVPNFGASIGVSYRWQAARVSLGYRADFFFNALDGGIATAKQENRGFFGPYASISIGIGD